MVSVLATDGAEAVPLMSRLVAATRPLLENTTVVPSTHTPRSDGYVAKTFLVPAANEILAPEALEARMVVRASVGPVVEYVPIPTSQAPALGSYAV
jgi:hypothetical protein